MSGKASSSSSRWWSGSSGPSASSASLAASLLRFAALVLLATALLGAAGAALHGAYDRVLAVVAGGLIGALEPAGHETGLDAVAGGIRVQPPYDGAQAFLLRTGEMHVSAPLFLALLVVGGPGLRGLRRRLGRLATGTGFLFAAHLAALVAQVEFQPLSRAGYHEGVYGVYRFAWWVLGVWGLLLLPALAAVAVYLMDFRRPPASPGAVRGRPLWIGAGALAGAVVVLTAGLAWLRPVAAIEPGGAGSVERGLEAFQAGRYDEAAEAFRTWLADDPGHAPVRFSLGVSLYRMGRFAEAIQELTLVRSVAPDHPGLDLTLGAVLYDLGERERALEAFARADLSAADDADVLVRVCEALLAGADLDAAERSCRRALEIDPTQAEALYRLGTVEMAAGRRDEALALFHRALALRPEHLEAHKYIALAHQQAGRPEAAAAAYRRALRIAPGDPGALFGLAAVLASSLEPCQAMEPLRRCAEPPGEEAIRGRCAALLEALEGRCGGGPG